MKKFIFITSLIIIIVGVVIGYLVIIKPKTQNNFSFVKVEKGLIKERVSVTGSVISDTKLTLKSELQGRILEIPVKVGETVQANQMLIKIDNKELLAQVSAANASLAMAEAKFKKIIEGSRPEEVQIYEKNVQSLKYSLQAAQTNLTTAQQNLTDVKKEAEKNINQAYEDALDTCRNLYTKADNAFLVLLDIRQDYFDNSSQVSLNVKEKENIALNAKQQALSAINQAEIANSASTIDTALNKLKVALLTLRDALSVIRTSLDDFSISPSANDITNIDTERTVIDTAIGTLITAQQNITTIDLTDQTNINAANAKIATAEDNLSIAETNLLKAEQELILKKAGPTAADRELAKAEVRQAQANLIQTQINLTKTEIKAPTDSTVTKIHYQRGEIVPLNQDIITLISSNQYQIEANVSETEITRIKIGDPIEMTFDAFGPDQIFQGQIISIEPAETVVSGVIYYKVKSILTDSSLSIRSGMTVNQDIITQAKDNVLYLPYYVIKEKNSHKYVEVWQNQKIIEKTVKTGIGDESNIEITEGLQFNEQVISNKK